jgi:hypothetical protein
MEKINNFKEAEITQGDARQHIEAVRAQVMQMGANDSENSDLEQVISEMEDGVISPQEAMQRADGIRDSKHSYH